MDSGAQNRLVQFFERIGAVLGNKKRKASFATYAMGLLGEGDRKSMEPIAARACGTGTPQFQRAVQVDRFFLNPSWKRSSESAGYQSWGSRDCAGSNAAVEGSRMVPRPRQSM